MGVIVRVLGAAGARHTHHTSCRIFKKTRTDRVQTELHEAAASIASLRHGHT
jgi:hypothetical protein